MYARNLTPREQNPELAPFETYIQPVEGTKYECTFCLDYGGVIDNNAPLDNEGLPQGVSCPVCQAPSFDDDY